MNFSIEGIDNVVDKLTQYASGDKIQRGLAMAGEVVRAHAGRQICFAYVKKTLDVLQWRSILHNVGASTTAVPRTCTEK